MQKWFNIVIRSMCVLIVFKFSLVEQSNREFILHHKHLNNNFMYLFQVEDGDSGDEVTLDLKGPDARMFQITPKGQLQPHIGCSSFSTNELCFCPITVIWSNLAAELKNQKEKNPLMVLQVLYTFLKITRKSVNTVKFKI